MKTRYFKVMPRSLKEVKNYSTARRHDCTLLVDDFGVNINHGECILVLGKKSSIAVAKAILGFYEEREKR